MKTIQKILLFYAIIFGYDAYGQRNVERIVNLRGYWKFNIGDNATWADPNYDDSRWDDIYVPAPWEEEGFHGYDGFAWYRVGFQLTEFDPEDELFISLGYIDDVDEVYLNGKLIGGKGSMPPHYNTAYNAKRYYRIPNEYLNPYDVNVIAVRVFDEIIDGGIVKGDIGIFRSWLKRSNSQYLDGIWKFSPGTDREWRNYYFNDDEWAVVSIPGYVEKRRDMRGYKTCTYRKTFVLKSSIYDSDDDLVLVMGKIDDFDKVFVNGRLVGQTNDYRPYMRSGSHSVFRVYSLLRDHLNPSGENTIIVEVEDLGGQIGIYQGPIGITTVDNIDRFIDGY